MSRAVIVNLLRHRRGYRRRQATKMKVLAAPGVFVRAKGMEPFTPMAGGGHGVAAHLRVCGDGGSRHGAW